MYNDVIKLIKQTTVINDLGEPTTVKQAREVFAKRISVGQKEFYEAMANGLKPEVKFEMADCYDYEDEELVEYNNKTYRVLRTYQKGQRTIELTCVAHINEVT